jgi:ABC-2 type transport system ATP-binding protein
VSQPALPTRDEASQAVASREGVPRRAGQLVLSAVAARDAYGPKASPRGRLVYAELSLDAGAVAVLGAPEDGSLALFDCLTGRRRPDRGVVAISGKAPADSAELRRHLGSLSMEPSLPDARTVRAALELAASARGDGRALAASALAGLGLEPLADRAPHTLSAGERRAIELALALATPSPAALVLVEPFAEVGGVSVASVLSAITRLAASCPVLVITASPSDAKRLARVLVLHRGAFVRETTGDHVGLAARGPSQLAVWIERGARALASRLALDPAVTGVVLDHVDPSQDRGTLRLTGPAVEPLALALAREAAIDGVSVSGLAEVAPRLPDVQAASEWELRSRYVAAAMMQGPPGAGPFGGVPFGASPIGAVPLGAPAFGAGPSGAPTGFVVPPRRAPSRSQAPEPAPTAPASPSPEAPAAAPDAPTEPNQPAPVPGPPASALRAGVSSSQTPHSPPAPAAPPAPASPAPAPPKGDPQP